MRTLCLRDDKSNYYTTIKVHVINIIFRSVRLWIRVPDLGNDLRPFFFLSYRKITLHHYSPEVTHFDCHKTANDF